jgi:hypothetical protein
VAVPLKYKSESKPWVSGAQLEFQTSSLPKQGPNGGRLVITAIAAHFDGQVDVTVGNWQGEDLYRIFAKTSVKQRDGLLRYNEVPGDAQRIYLYQEFGGDKTKEHADVAVANNVAVKATMWLPLKKRYSQRDEDYALAAQLLQHVKITCATTTDVSVGGATVAFDSGNYYLIFECIEEMDICYHAVDEIKVQDFESTTAQEARLNVNGRLQSLALYVRGGDGGASLANLTSAWIHQPQNMAPELALNPDLQEFYARERNECTGISSTTGSPIRSNPFTASTIRACSVLMSTGQSCFEQPETDTVVVKTSHTLGATITMVARIAKPRLPGTAAGIVKFYRAQGVKLSGRFRVKTKSKSMQHPGAWRPEHLAYLPIKFV